MSELIKFSTLKHGENPFELKSPFARNKTSRLRRELFNKNPHCHWCAKLTVLNFEWKGGKPGTFPNDAATIDHIVNRRMSDSREYYISRANMVLSCYKCNINRAQNDNCLIQADIQRLKAHDPELYNKYKLEHYEKQKERGCNGVPKPKVNHSIKFDKQTKLDLLEKEMAAKFPDSPGRDIKHLFLSDKPIDSFVY